MSKVFIIEPLRRDLDTSEAEKWGKIQYLIESGERRCSPFQVPEFSELILAKLVSCKYDPTSDYICVVGSMLTVAISLIAIAQQYNEFGILLFNSTMNTYVERQISTKGQVNGVKS